MSRWRLLRRILTWTLGILLLLIIVLYALARIYNDELKDLALAEINKSLKTKVDVREVELTLIQRFPRASLRFTDVYIQGTSGPNDTLLAAQTVHLEFGLLDVLSGIYTVKSVGISGARVNIKRDAAGKPNYLFWKESEGDGAEFRFSVDELTIESSSLEWSDLQLALSTTLEVSAARLQGEYSESTLETELQFDGHIDSWQMPWSPKLENRALSMEGNFSMNTEESILFFKPLSVVLDDFPLEINGSLITGAKSAIDLQLMSPDADLSTVTAILPKEIDESMAVYAISGRADLKATLSGVIQSGQTPDINIEVPMRKGSFTHRPSGTELHNLHTDIVYSNLKGVSTFNIRNVEGAFQSSPFSIKGTIINPTAPRFDLACRGEFPLTEVLSFFRLDSALTADGVIALSGQFAGAFQDVKNITPAEWANLDISGNLQFEKVKLASNGQGVALENLQGSCQMTNNVLSSADLNLTVNNNDFALNGEVSGLLPYLTTDEGVLTVNAACKSETVKVEELLTKGTGNKEAEVTMPSRIVLKLDLDWKEATYRQFKAEQITASLNYSAGELQINPLVMRTCDGILDCSFKITDKIRHFDFSAIGNLNRVDLNKLFVQFENFGQTFLTGENLKGKLQSGFVLSFQTDKYMEMKPKTISCVAQVKVENGELIQLKSLRNISDYLKKKKLLSTFVDADGLEKKLKHVTFQTLENTIRVSNGNIVFPYMEIKSSALDITVEGQQTFEYKIDYTIGFYLRDVLMKKKRDADETDDGLGKTFFIRMTGTTENPVFSIDREAAKDKRRKDIETEKALIKQILKEEFKGSTDPAKPSINDAKPATMDVHWEENKPEEKPVEEEKKKKKRSLKDLLGGEEEEDF